MISADVPDNAGAGVSLDTLVCPTDGGLCGGPTLRAGVGSRRSVLSKRCPRDRSSTVSGMTTTKGSSGVLVAARESSIGSGETVSVARVATTLAASWVAVAGVSRSAPAPEVDRVWSLLATADTVASFVTAVSIDPIEDCVCWAVAVASAERFVESASAS